MSPQLLHAGRASRVALLAVGALLLTGALAGGIVLSTRGFQADEPAAGPEMPPGGSASSSAEDAERGGASTTGEEAARAATPGPSARDAAPGTGGSPQLGRPPSPTPPPNAEALRAPGTTEMVRRLAEIAAQVDPRQDPYRASRQIQMLQQQPVPTDLEQRLQREAQLGLLHLMAGQVQEAVRRLESVRQTLGGRAAVATNDSVRQITELLVAANLRLGEQANCAENHNADSCLFPIAGGGVHADPMGSQAAVRDLEALLALEPDDLLNRWLLNVAHMTLGSYPEGVPKAQRISPEAFASEADIGRFWDVAPGAGVAVPDLSGGVVLDDLDGDGLLDIAASSWGAQDQLRLFINQGDGTFQDRTAEAGLIGLTGGLNMVQADYDNDGDVDLFVLRGAWRFEQGKVPNSLLRNDGAGRFEDVTRDAGLWREKPTQTAAWADFDGDGDVDLFVGNESQPGSGGSATYGIGGVGTRLPAELFRNEGDGTFTEIAAEAGADVTGFIKAVVWGDVDEDGDPDLYVSRMLESNVLLRNDGPSPEGESWRFTDITAQAGVAEPAASFPSWFWDQDNDGDLDLFVSGYGNPTRFLEDTAADVAADYLGLPTDAARPRLYRNAGDGRFEDVAPGSGIDDVLHAMGANHGDLDNDGRPDAYIGTGEPDYRGLMPNRAYRNAGDGRFQDVTTSAGLGHLQKGHAVAFGDVDNDGDQDIYTVLGGALEGDWYHNALFENPGHGHRWITLRLSGRQANRAGIGARIRVDVDAPEGARSIHHLVGSGGSFGANSLQAEIGLSEATAIRSVEIRWPGSGTVDVHTDVAMDQVYRAEEGAAALETAPAPTMELPEPHAPGQHDGMSDGLGD